MTTFFTADHHFRHANIIKYSNRPFSSVGEMDEIMVQRWNTVVRPGDTVYHLGDFTLGNRDVAAKYWDRLTGEKILVPGGHDARWVDLRTAQLLRIIRLEGVTITLCHYPMLTWEKSHYGRPHFHGHTHGTVPDAIRRGVLEGEMDKGSRIDVGVDRWDFYPVAWETLKKLT